jgi:hypothetical protein
VNILPKFPYLLALVRGLVCGAKTALGGLGQTLPFLASRFLRSAVHRCIFNLGFARKVLQR